MLKLNENHFIVTSEAVHLSKPWMRDNLRHFRGKSIKVLFGLMSLLMDGNASPTTKELAEASNVAPATVTKAMKLFLSRGIVERVEQ